MSKKELNVQELIYYKKKYLFTQSDITSYRIIFVNGLMIIIKSLRVFGKMQDINPHLDRGGMRNIALLGERRHAKVCESTQMPFPRPECAITVRSFSNVILKFIFTCQFHAYM